MRKNLLGGILFSVLLAVALAQPSLAQSGAGGSWVKLYEGANVINLFIQDDKNLWAVAENSVILQSRDGGHTWEKRYESGLGWLSDIFMRDARNGWAVGSGGMILATTDGGKTWAHQQGVGGTDYNCVYFSDVNHGFIGAGTGLMLHTEDGGKKWIAQQFKFPAPPPPAGSPSAAPSTPPPPNVMRRMGFIDANHAIVLKDNDSVLITENGGKGWKSSNFPEGFAFEHLYVHGNSAWLGGGRKLASGTVLASLWSSPDGGKTWKPINTAHLLIHGIDSVWFADEQNGIISVDGKLYRTTDGGVNWTPFYMGDEKVRHIFARDANHIWAIIGGSIYRYEPKASTQANASQ